MRSVRSTWEREREIRSKGTAKDKEAEMGNGRKEKLTEDEIKMS